MENDPARRSVVSLRYLVGEEVEAVAGDPRLLGLLSDEERGRMSRFHFAADASRFGAGRILARYLLAALSGTFRKRWTIEPDSGGRPRVVGSREARSLDFNITHTDGLVACVAARGPTVGLDAEARSTRPDLMRIARRFFASEEIAFLERISPDERPKSFYAYWTLKESFVKATGDGLTTPLDAFAFDLGVSPPGWTCTSRLVSDPDRWDFRLWEPTERHTVALAARSLPGQRLEVHVRRQSPAELRRILGRSDA